MSAPREEAGLALQWLREAVEELQAGRRLAEHADVPSRIAAFHAHLSAEKALEALAFHRGRRPGRVHDLARLHVSLTEADATLISIEDLELLNPWQTAGRYPADLPDQSPAELMMLLQA